MSDASDSQANARTGVLFGFATYAIWGVFPIYFKWIESVAPTEILVHRIVWAVPFGALILSLRRQWPELWAALRNPGVIGWLTLSALCISGNWLVYIWGVVNERIFEASLGYYINPLMYVLVGVLFFHERLRKLQWAAVALATTGVLVLTLYGGILPWVSVSLAALFTAYGVIRKQVAIGPMPGLFAETALLFPIGAAWLAYLVATQQSSFLAGDAQTDLLLILAGPVTVLPLLFFAIAARNLTLTALGFMQYLAPTLQFAVGVYYGEELTTAHMICFGCIWAAVAIFSYDAIRAARKQKRALGEGP